MGPAVGFAWNLPGKVGGRPHSFCKGRVGEIGIDCTLNCPFSPFFRFVRQKK
jgi:hypothetical protein